MGRVLTRERVSLLPAVRRCFSKLLICTSSQRTRHSSAASSFSSCSFLRREGRARPPMCVCPPPSGLATSRDSGAASGSPSPTPLPVDEEGDDGDGQEDQADHEGQDLQDGQAGCAARGGR